MVGGGEQSRARRFAQAPPVHPAFPSPRRVRRIANRARRASLPRVLTLILLAPLFLALEVGQLVLSERYLGIKQIARRADPRTLGLGEVTAFFWASALIIYYGWMLTLLISPLGRIHGLALLGVTAVGYSLRRGSKLKWVLVILTFEGAFRVGLLLSLCAMVWRRL